MKFTVISVGKVKEKFYRDALNEYIKRLGAYGGTNMIEVKDEACPEHYSEAEKKAVLDTEGRRILEKIPENAYVIVLEIEGKKYSSEDFAKTLEELALKGNSHFCFIIGGSLGLSKDVLAGADLRLSFSDMTFPHQLMRVILLEQIYRAMKIGKGEPYHK